MKIAFLDVTAMYREIQAEIEVAALRALRSGRYIGGDEVAQFESEFAKYVGSRFCVGVANGLDALHLSLRALGIGAGDEVLVPSNTFIATWLAVTHCGARPIPVEPYLGTCNMDVSKIEQCLTPRTRAIIPVHLYGQPADLEGVGTIARRHDLRVVEDAAQAHGARFRGVRIGAHSELVAWSFYPAKNLGAVGDAGAVTSNDANLAEAVRSFGNYGSRIRYVNEVCGYNSRLDPVNAAVLRVKLKHLDRWNARRTAVAARYQEGLQGVGLKLPEVAEWADPVWHLYCVRHPARDVLQDQLAKEGIETHIHYPVAPHLQHAYRYLGLCQGSLPVSESMSRELLSLPIGPTLSDVEADYVIRAVRRALGY